MLRKLAAGILAGFALATVSAKTSAKISLSGAGGEKTFDTIQAALDSIGSGAGSYTIKLAKGTYEEVLYYNGAADITISGDSSAKYGKDVIIAKDNDGDLLRLKKAGSQQKNRCLFEFEGTGSLVLENLTLHNTFVRGTVKGSNTQAEALGFDSTGTVAAYNCSFKSHQDTLRTTGKSWFVKCYVEGDTDFIWMESTGKVALFEECEIVSVYDEHASNHTSYVGAPRMDITSKSAKGLVIFNSRITSQKGQTTYLARTPWTNGYFNQVAVIDTKTKGIDKEIWSGSPLMSEGVPQTVIGWKMDKKTAKNLGIKTDGRKDIVSDSDAENEFGGRRAILNRYYNEASNRYLKDTDTNWDVDALISKYGWKVSKDKSSDLLKGETEGAKTVYLLDGKADVSALKCEGFAQEKGKAHYVGAAGSKISFPVKAKSLVTITGYYSGAGTVQAGKQGAALYNLNNGTTSKFIDNVYAVYEGASTVTITASDKSYITKITVEEDPALKFTPVTSITVNSAKNAEQLLGKKSLQMSVVLNPSKPTNNAIVWSVSDTSAASIDENGVLTALAVKADTDIMVRATSRDEKAAFGEKKIKILMPEAGSFSVSWLDSPEASSSLEGTSDDVTIAKAGKAVPSKGTWKYNSSKVTSDIAKGALSYSGYSSGIQGKDTVYIEFPITAVQKFTLTNIDIAFGNHGTSNMGAELSYTTGKDYVTIIDDDTRSIRSAKKAYKTTLKPIVVEKGQTIKVRVALYGYNGDMIAIPTGKAPTIGTISISGKASK